MVWNGEITIRRGEESSVYLEVANSSGSLDTYLRSKRFQQLLQGRLADARRRGDSP